MVWPRAAKLVHRIRRIGLEDLLRLPPSEVQGFFEQFFALPERHRWTYLTARDDIRGNLATMGCLFRESDNRLRRFLVTPAMRPPLLSNDEVATGRPPDS